MIPALGRVQAHHFRHKSIQISCSTETYLHEAAKHAFHDGFCAAKANGRPYTIIRNRPVICRRQEELFGLTCHLQDIPASFDLTRHLDHAMIEKRILSYIADVLLESDDGQRQLLVEIEVTHACTHEKLSSGLKILEIRVGCDADIAGLMTGIDMKRSDMVRGHNFGDLVETSPPDCRDCPHKVELLQVYRSGKIRVSWERLPAAAAIARGGAVIHAEIIPKTVVHFDRPVRRIDHYARIAHFDKGVPMRSCLLCRFADFTWHPQEGDPPLRCFKGQGENGLVSINAAASCQIYSPFGSAVELERHRAHCDARRRQPRYGLRFGALGSVGDDEGRPRFGTSGYAREDIRDPLYRPAARLKRSRKPRKDDTDSLIE
ncbi:hypothetical protein ACEUZ9_004075 [Paracoccus litorisediminis]|uniref:hypothetical protein n=1 Tax=Paracoccus litorisediminis TaxID=2006130 RepID=UPI0037312EB4